jgi:hypothetical protein
VRIADDAGHQRYRYTAPAFNFTCGLIYDESSLVLDYPGIARRTRLSALGNGYHQLIHNPSTRYRA